MMNEAQWTIRYLPSAAKDLEKLDRFIAARVMKTIERVAENPLPYTEGGYGKPLGNKSGSPLSGLLKIKIKNPALRIVYRLERLEGKMVILVIAAREEGFVYNEAVKRSDMPELTDEQPKHMKHPTGKRRLFDAEPRDNNPWAP